MCSSDLAMWGYALDGANPADAERTQAFFDRVDPGRAGTTVNPL